MKRFFISILAVIGAFTVLTTIFTLCGLYTLSSFTKPKTIAHNTVLTISLGHQALPEKSGGKNLISLVKEDSSYSLKELVNAVDSAAKDPRIQGILLQINGNRLGLAQIQEIRDALKKFRTTGKVVYTFADTFGEESNGTAAYYLATAGDKIWLQPVGEVGLTGMMAEVPFAKKILEDFKIQPRIEHRGKYKSLPESLMEQDFTPPSKENLQTIINTLLNKITADIADERHLPVEEVKQLVNQGPYLDKAALKVKLIDSLGYLNDVKSAFQEKLKNNVHYVSLKSYLKHMDSEKSSAQTIAVVYVTGIIMRESEDEGDEWFHTGITTAQAIHQATDDNRIKAIILRINSGGGSPTASETIWHALQQAKEKGKPVIVSMSDMAASGGYWIASGANKIVAHPATLTGSIGVFGGKIVTGNLWSHYGIDWREVHYGNNVGMYSDKQDYSPEGLKKLQDFLDEIYATFQEKVVKGRNLSPEKVLELAEGRVWTGLEAKENGLVDALGGFSVAVDLVKQALNLKPEERITLEDFPKKKSFAEKLMKVFLDDGETTFFSTPSTLLTKFFTLIESAESIASPAPLKAPSIRLTS